MSIRRLCSIRSRADADSFDDDATTTHFANSSLQAELAFKEASLANEVQGSMSNVTVVGIGAMGNGMARALLDSDVTSVVVG